MSNDPKADLIYAILAMDSYSRGYGSGVTGLEDSGDKATIGNYSVIQNISNDGWFNAGFYAIAYRNTATNEVVISYRGTDFNGNWPTFGDVSRASHTHHSSS
jgi:hypothetical protein